MFESKSPMVRLAMFCPCFFNSLISPAILMISDPLKFCANTDTFIYKFLRRAKIGLLRGKKNSGIAKFTHPDCASLVGVSEICSKQKGEKFITFRLLPLSFYLFIN